MENTPPVSDKDQATEKDKTSNKGTARYRQYWGEIERYDRKYGDWKKRGKKIVDKYLDEKREQAEHDTGRVQARRMAILWSNVETLKPAVYAKTPTVVAGRRHKDPDPIGRIAAELLERVANTSYDLYDYDEVFQMVRDDRLLPGRGVAWIRYEAEFEQVPEDGDNDAEPKTRERIASEKVCADHVDFCDFGHNVARKWSEVWLVWRVVHKTKAEAKEKFGDVADKLVYDVKEDGDSNESDEPKACIYEVWDKKRKRMCFVSKEHKELIEDGAPPLDLHGFFPCPRPCYGTKTGKALIPTPDYRYYQDQAEEIDDLTAKIAQLCDWLVLKGFVPAGPSSAGGDALMKALEEASNQEIFVRVESWMEFTEKGGAKMVEWIPLDLVIQALQGAIQSRKQLIDDVYQITGVADVLRGATDPKETLGAQELKAQTGSRRIKNTKDEIARFCRDVSRLVCEVIAENFQPETIAAMSGYQYVPQMPPEQREQIVQQGMQDAQTPLIFDDEVLKRLRGNHLRSYTIEIETDSTVQPDEDAEKQRRVEFATMFGEFLGRAGELMQLGPLAAPLVPTVAEALKFTVRGFRAGRALEDTIERSMSQLISMVQQQAQQPPPPDPEQIKAEAEQQRIQMEMQADEKRLGMEMQHKEREAQIDAQMKAMDLQMKQQELRLKEQSMQLQMMMEQMKMQMDGQRMRQDMAMDQERASMERQSMADHAAFDREKTQNERVRMAQQPNGVPNGQ